MLPQSRLSILIPTLPRQYSVGFFLLLKTVAQLSFSDKNLFEKSIILEVFIKSLESSALCFL